MLRRTFRFILRWTFAAVLAIPVFGADWVEYRSGPFHVFSDAGDKHGREALTQLEQLRFVLGQMFGGASGATLGTRELTTVWPIYLVLFDNEKEYAPHVLQKTLTEGGAETLATWTADAGTEKGKDLVLPHDLMRAVTMRLIEDNPVRLPDEIENGLGDLFSTLQVAGGTRVTLGTPLAPGELTGDRLREWAKLQMLATQPDFAGKLRVYVNNLAQAGEEDAAARNAYGIPAVQLNQRAAAYFAAGKFEAIAVNGRPIDPKRDFIEKDVPQDEQVVAKAAAKASAERAAEEKRAADRRAADKKAMEKRAQKRAAAENEATPKYQIEGVPLPDPKSDRAKSDVPSEPVKSQTEPTKPAVETQAPKEAAAPASPVVTVAGLMAELNAQGKTFPPGSPRALFAENTLLSLGEAAKSNPRWAEPHFKMAALETNPAKKVADLKTAASLGPRNPEYWQSLAMAQTAANLFADAEKSWTAAERAAPNATERGRIHRAKLDLEDQRAAFELAERQRQREEEARELQRIKDSAAAEVHAAEQAANARLGATRGNVANPVPFAEAGFGDPGGTPVSGSLTRVDCLAGGPLRLTILQATGRPVSLLIRDLKKLMVAGADSGQAEFACGVQKPARKIEVRHDAKADAKFETLGDIAVVKFP